MCALPKPIRITDESYDPMQVDWVGMIRTVKDISAREPRFCSFAMRSHFHDSGSWDAAAELETGSDGSILTDDNETFFVRPSSTPTSAPEGTTAFALDAGCPADSVHSPAVVSSDLVSAPWSLTALNATVACF